MNPFGWGFRLATVLLGFFFAFCAVLQVNDPDPVGWAAIYAAAAMIAFIAVRGPMHPVAPVLLAIGAAAWAVQIGRSLVKGTGTFEEAARHLAVVTPALEQGREMLGLLLVMFWMAVIAIRCDVSRRRERIQESYRGYP